MVQMTDEEIKKALNGEDAQEEETKMQQTIDVDPQTGDAVPANYFQKQFQKNEDAYKFLDVLDAKGYVDGVDYRYDRTNKTLVLALTQAQLEELVQQINIDTVATGITTTANGITSVVSTGVNYALNAGLAPVVGSVANAGFTTARVVGSAGVKIAAATGATLLRNSRAFAKEVYNSREIADCGHELKETLSCIGNFLTGRMNGSVDDWQKVSA